jgi:hypothetical protein
MSKQNKQGHVVASFEYSIELELAISELKERGIESQSIIAVPLDEIVESPQLFDTIHHADGVSLLDLGLILGCIFMLLGTIYGFVLKWGPIIWGLIGLILGLFIGIMIKMLFLKKNQRKNTKKKNTEVCLVVKCNENQFEMVKNVLFNHYALGIGYLNK